MFFFSSRRRNTECALVTVVQTCALPIYRREPLLTPTDHLTARDKSHRRLLDRRPVIGIFESQHVSCKRIDLFRRDFEVHDLGKIMRILEPRVEGLSGQSGSVDDRLERWRLRLGRDSGIDRMTGRAMLLGKRQSLPLD